MTTSAPELESAAARVLAMLLHESPIPVPIAADMLMDAGCEDRSDVAYLLFRAAGDELAYQLPIEPAFFESEGYERFMLAWNAACAIARCVRGQVLPSDARVQEFIELVNALMNLGLTAAVAHMALCDWRDRLLTLLPILREIEQHEAEER